MTGRPRGTYTPVVTRLWCRVPLGGPDECWNWPGYTSGGYGHIGDRSTGAPRTLLVHRVAWEDRVGPIPDGLTVDHTCENQRCCNTGHMELVTLAENSRRQAARRWARKWMAILDTLTPDDLRLAS